MTKTNTQRELGPVWGDYVGDVWVSTIYRESSAREYASPYFETMAFPRSPVPPEILWHSAAGYEREARRQHDLAIRWFVRAGGVTGQGEKGLGDG